MTPKFNLDLEFVQLFISSYKIYIVFQTNTRACSYKNKYTIGKIKLETKTHFDLRSSHAESLGSG